MKERMKLRGASKSVIFPSDPMTQEVYVNFDMSSIEETGSLLDRICRFVIISGALYYSELTESEHFTGVMWYIRRKAGSEFPAYILVNECVDQASIEFGNEGGAVAN
jgi:hypothetical protein